HSTIGVRGPAAFPALRPDEQRPKGDRHKHAEKVALWLRLLRTGEPARRFPPSRQRPILRCRGGR
ncbi:MAG: hypothetical protein WAO15_09805, partial [Mycobacterium sp.]